MPAYQRQLCLFNTQYVILEQHWFISIATQPCRPPSCAVLMPSTADPTAAWRVPQGNSRWAYAASCCMGRMLSTTGSNSDNNACWWCASSCEMVCSHCLDSKRRAVSTCMYKPWQLEKKNLVKIAGDIQVAWRSCGCNDWIAIVALCQPVRTACSQRWTAFDLRLQPWSNSCETLC